MFLAFSSLLGWADYFDDVGFTELALELGVHLPDGSSVQVSQVEASTSTNSSIYFPDTNNVEFIAKQIVDSTGASAGSSSHATTAGRYFYGLSSSLSPGVSTVAVYSASNWLNDELSPGVFGADPRVEDAQVQNHSWIGSSASADAILMRLDHMIHRDGVVAVVGTDNGASATQPDLLNQAYNAIAVGRSSGGHSYGDTTLPAAGRMKPDLVAPFGATSWSTALISSAAALLLDHGGVALANRPQLTKAILMAGATKHEISDWSRTAARPLDQVYGAGELNIYRSYHILEAGEQSPSTSNTLELLGWDILPMTGSATERYFFDVPSGYVLHRFSILTTWNRIIGDNDIRQSRFVPFVEVFRDVDLTLRESAAFVPGSLVDQSTSRVDNVEHIYQSGLPAGQYVLEVTSDGAVDCGLAWMGELVSLPSSPSLTLNASEEVLISFGVTEGFDYRIEATEFLNPASLWQTIYSGRVSSNVLEYIDSDASEHQKRYYRFGPEP